MARDRAPDRRFFDTGIFVASFNEIDQRRRGLARGLIREALQQGDVLVSHQVVAEFLDQATTRFARPLSGAQAHEYLRVVLRPLCQITQSIELQHDALSLVERWGLPLADAGVLAAATRAQCGELLTDGRLAGRQFGSVRCVDPFG